MIEDALVVVPAFNEAAVIGETLKGLLEVAAHVLVVDDGSTDRTRAIARESGAAVLRLCTNLNYGGALQAGFRYALRRTDFPFILTFDADGQHDPAFLEALLEPLRRGLADYTLGSRYLEGGDRSVSGLRHLGTRLLAGAASLAMESRITDPTSGLVGMTREVARVFLTDLFPQDYPDADMIIMLERMGFRIEEAPVRMHPSPSGKSMHSGLMAPLYYIAKMGVSMLHLATRGDLPARRKEAQIAA